MAKALARFNIIQKLFEATAGKSFHRSDFDLLAKGIGYSNGETLHLILIAPAVEEGLLNLIVDLSEKSNHLYEWLKDPATSLLRQAPNLRIVTRKNQAVNIPATPSDESVLKFASDLQKLFPQQRKFTCDEALAHLTIERVYFYASISKAILMELAGKMDNLTDKRRRFYFILDQIESPTRLIINQQELMTLENLCKSELKGELRFMEQDLELGDDLREELLEKLMKFSVISKCGSGSKGEIFRIQLDRFQEAIENGKVQAKACLLIDEVTAQVQSKFAKAEQVKNRDCQSILEKLKKAQTDVDDLEAKYESAKLIVTDLKEELRVQMKNTSEDSDNLYYRAIMMELESCERKRDLLKSALNKPVEELKEILSAFT